MGSCFGSCAAAAATPARAHVACTSTSTSSTHSTSPASAALPTASTPRSANNWLWPRPRTGCRANDSSRSEPKTKLSKRHCQQNGFIYRILSFNRRRQCRSFLDKVWEQQPSYTKLQCGRNMPDIQMQRLDACKLLNAQPTSIRETEMGIGTYQRLASSRASSSLDLEWEHEYSQLRQYQLHCQQAFKEAPPTPPRPRFASRSSRQNSWSHMSTPESLEWDVDEHQLRLEDDSIDDGTLKLLHQIEQLKHHVLQETGGGINVEIEALEELNEGLQFRTTHFGAGSQLEAHISKSCT
ncbi:uncharacterized protein LOC108093016 isoform X2 [Drosophila ficusphila]|uniref:uncharacterized protein LOC108093016 isoform X2 n=1 Tax=Drosophila ficusphila TaxID=30025 RepID=UPI0007E5E292|nr:uncharacterized protein LOC108093016 isoform X2 [Drosophila ficusphila]